MFPDVDFRHFIMNFIAREQFLFIYNTSFWWFLGMEKSMKMKQIFLKTKQIFVSVFPESSPIEMRGIGIKPVALWIKY